MFISACLLIQSNNNNLSIRDQKPLLALSIILDVALLSISIFAILLATSSGNCFGLNSAFGYSLIGSSVLLSTVLSMLILSILKIKTSKEEYKKQIRQLSEQSNTQNKIDVLSTKIQALEKIYESCKTSKQQLQALVDDLKEQRTELEKQVKIAISEGHKHCHVCKQNQTQ